MVCRRSTSYQSFKTGEKVVTSVVMTLFSASVFCVSPFYSFILTFSSAWVFKFVAFSYWLHKVLLTSGDPKSGLVRIWNGVQISFRFQMANYN